MACPSAAGWSPCSIPIPLRCSWRSARASARSPTITIPSLGLHVVSPRGPGWDERQVRLSSCSRRSRPSSRPISIICSSRPAARWRRSPRRSASRRRTADSGRVDRHDRRRGRFASLAGRQEHRAERLRGCPVSRPGMGLPSPRCWSEARAPSAALRTGAQLFVADVYGGNRAAGSATSIVQALGWLSSHHPQVINISLVGPSNRLVQRAIQIVQSRGIRMVAAVGNDGPAAPPQYPASYPGVVAVTAVDAVRPRSARSGPSRRISISPRPAPTWPRPLPARAMPGFAGRASPPRLPPRGCCSPARRLRSPQRPAPGKGRVGRGIVCGACRIDPRGRRRPLKIRAPG